MPRVNIKSSGTKYCAQCVYWSGPREVVGGHTLIYENNSTGNCNKTSSPRGPKAGSTTKGNGTCSAFQKFGV